MTKIDTASREHRFWERVAIKGSSECWNWLRSTKNGYGRFTFGYVEHYAHRQSYELVNGPIPDDKHVMHSCNNKRCCNPAHLSLGTASENTQAAYRDGLARSGLQHPKTKYDAAFIRRVAEDPRPQLAIAADLGISQSHVSRIKTGQTRRWDNA